MSEGKEASIVKHEGGGLQSEQPSAAPMAVSRSETVSDKVIDMLGVAATVEFTGEQKEILFAPIEDEIVEIRPDGLIYLPWMEYVTRLRDAFGGKWAIIPATPKPEMSPSGNSLMWGFYLFVDGKPYGYAIGEQEYHENNPAMSWSDACEGAKSNALMRLCKGIGIGLELWKPSFIKAWKEKYAEKCWDNNAWDARRGKKGKYLWRKKGDEPKGHTSKSKRKEDGEKADEDNTEGDAPFAPYIPEEGEDDSPLPGIDQSKIASGDKKKPEVSDAVKDIVQMVKVTVEKMNNLDYTEFKKYLYGVQGKMGKRFIGKQYGNLSLTEGNEEDLWYLAQNMQTALDAFVKSKKGKEKKSGNKKS